jgi:nicotinamidase-related amidase
LPLPAEITSSIDLSRTAFVQIDMQRRHVDPNVGYHLVDAAKASAIVGASTRLLRGVRASEALMVHVATYARRPAPWGMPDQGNPFWKYQHGKIIPGMGKPRDMFRNLEGSVYAEMMPELMPERDEPVVVKKRYSGFHQTDLEMILRARNTETVFLWGVNTNNCVLATAYDAFSRDFLVAVVSDASGSMNGESYHAAALKQVEAALGFIVTVSEVEELLAGHPGSGRG